MNKSSVIYHQLYPSPSSKYTLVFIHGALCSHLHWTFQVSYLYSLGFQILTCDLPGHGSSSARPNYNCTIEDFSNDVIQLLKKLQISTPIVLIGHSMGTRIAVEMYQQNMLDKILKIAGLVLIDSGFDSELNMQIKDKDFATAKKIIIPNSYKKLCDAILKKMVVSSTPSNICQLIISDMKKTTPEVGIKAFTNLFLYDCHKIPNIISKIEVPILALQSTLKLGGKRLSISKDTAKLSTWLDLIKTVHTHQIKLFNDTGHFIMLEHPKKVNQYIYKFIANL